MLPDVEAVACQVLATALTLPGGTKIPADATWPRWVVTRVGGRPVDAWEDDARLQVDLWGATDDNTGEGDDAAVMDLARTAVAALQALRGRYTVAGVPCWVSTTAVDLGPIRSPDPITGRPRALLGCVVSAHPST